ncbi:bacterial hemoglobin [Lentinus brumalis]|uniref:nitric oxide dioxygenase n=1 Tax=Lentinus brumalis TaxID=2498619 RepID=A0A371DXP5_9APHY|nr:bacterial hemoglobin [Polyporus brumalis]
MGKVIDTGADLPHPPPLTAEQRKLISATVPILAEHGVTITTLMYKRMLEAYPDMKNIFSHSKQMRGHQPQALASAVYAYAAHIEDLTPILPVVERIAHKHASVHIIPSQYAIVGTHLLGAMSEVLGADTFNGDLYNAWETAYWNLAHIFIDRERQLYEAAAWTGWREFVVEKKVKESDEITSFYFRPKDSKPLDPYRPGQYISIQRFIPELGHYQNRQYSLSDASSPEHYRISVKREDGIRTVKSSGELDTKDAGTPGWMSNLLHATLHEGDTVELAYPFGEFYLDDSSAPVVLLSAGVGLTPLLSMLNTLVSSETKRPVSWIQAVRNSRVHAFKSHVSSMAKANPEQVKTAIFYSSPVEGDVQGQDYDFLGRLDVDKVDRSVLRLDDPSAQYYVCGPEVFMAATFKALKTHGVDGSRIHAEVFGAGANPA